MSKRVNYYFFIGTLAELIKISPVINEMQRRRVNFKLISTGQNEIKINELENLLGGVKFTFNFPKKSKNSSVALFLLWSIKTFFYVMVILGREMINTKGRKYIFIHGDTVSALLGAIISKFFRIKLIHIESGLRSFNYLEPFPEEICRVFISHMADYHFCPNDWSLNNLKSRKGKKVNTKNNTVMECVDSAIKQKSKNIYINNLKNVKYFVLVLHRQEHMLYQKVETKKIIRSIKKLTKKNLKCVFLMHDLTKNFLISEKLYDSIERNPNFISVPRLQYVDFIHLMNNSVFVASDGGSNQEELYYLNKPCLILRNHTERIEGLGENAVLCKNSPKILNNFFKNYKKFKVNKVRPKVRPSKIIVDYILNEK